MIYNTNCLLAFSNSTNCLSNHNISNCIEKHLTSITKRRFSLFLFMILQGAHINYTQLSFYEAGMVFIVSTEIIAG